MAMIFLGGLFATIPAGRMTDRMPAGYALGGGLIGIAAGLALAAMAPSAPIFFLGLLIVGVSMGTTDPATNVLVSANVTRRSRGFVMGVKQTGFTVGGLLGGLILPTVAEAADWRLAFVVPLVACVVAAVFSFRVAGTPPETLERLVGEPIRPASLVGMGTYGFMMTAVQITLLAYLAVYLVDRQGLTATTAGLAIAVTLAGATVGRIVWGVLSDRVFGRRIVALQLAALGAIGGLVVLTLVGADPVLWPALFILGFCAIGWNTVYITMAAESVSPANVGRATGTALVFSYAGALVGPPLFGILVQSTDSWSTTWILAASALALGLAMFTFYARRVQEGVVPASRPAGK